MRFPSGCKWSVDGGRKNRARLDQKCVCECWCTILLNDWMLLSCVPSLSALVVYDGKGEAKF
jgi:hypothetical protein